VLRSNLREDALKIEDPIVIARLSLRARTAKTFASHGQEDQGHIMNGTLVFDVFIAMHRVSRGTFRGVGALS
jgi:hypothetical protein